MVGVLRTQPRKFQNPLQLGVLRPNRGSKPEPPKIPSLQIHPSHERVQVDHLGVVSELAKYAQALEKVN